MVIERIFSCNAMEVPRSTRKLKMSIKHHKNFQQKSQTNKSYIMVVTGMSHPFFYGGMAYDIDYS